MGQWLATVEFPDGQRAYATYSTVVEAIFEGLYPACYAVGDMMESGYRCERRQPAGDPEPHDWDAPISPVDELVPVVITTEPDDVRWHAVYCSRRAMVLGPTSGHHLMTLADEFYLVPGPDGVRHLLLASYPPTTTAACGIPAPGQPLPFHRPFYRRGMPGPRPPEPPRIDLFADWTTGDTCRDCLLYSIADPDRPSVLR